jgi:hypothetical protein
MARLHEEVFSCRAIWERFNRAGLVQGLLVVVEKAPQGRPFSWYQPCHPSEKSGSGEKGPLFFPGLIDPDISISYVISHEAILMNRTGKRSSSYRKSVESRRCPYCDLVFSPGAGFLSHLGAVERCTAR